MLTKKLQHLLRNVTCVSRKAMVFYIGVRCARQRLQYPPVLQVMLMKHVCSLLFCQSCSSDPSLGNRMEQQKLYASVFINVASVGHLPPVQQLLELHSVSTRDRLQAGTAVLLLSSRDTSPW